MMIAALLFIQLAAVVPDSTQTVEATAIQTPTQTADGSGVSVDATGQSAPATVTQATAVPTAEATAVPTTDGTVVQKVETRGVEPDYALPPYIRVSPRGPNSLWGGMGLQAGLTDNSTGGFRIAVGYMYRFTRTIWFDSEFAANFGGDCDKQTSSTGDTYYTCGGMSGFGTSLLAGIMWRSLDSPRWRIDLTPYLRGLAGVAFIFSNGPNDGMAIVAKGAAGARYAFTPEISVGAEFGLSIGPSFRNQMGAGGYTTFDFTIIGEYSF